MTKIDQNLNINFFPKFEKLSLANITYFQTLSKKLQPIKMKINHLMAMIRTTSQKQNLETRFQVVSNLALRIFY